MITEADTCRQYVLPNLYRAGWTDELIREQKTFTDGRILVQGRNARRGKQKRVDYLLYSRRDFPIAVVEAKSAYLSPGQGLQQAINYASGTALVGRGVARGLSELGRCYGPYAARLLLISSDAMLQMMTAAPFPPDLQLRNRQAFETCLATTLKVLAAVKFAPTLHHTQPTREILLTFGSELDRHAAEIAALAGEVSGFAWPRVRLVRAPDSRAGRTVASGVSRPAFSRH
nr:hypothetical protein [Deinococcus alpinitundrae]